MGFYQESVDRPNKTRVAAADVHVGELVATDGNGGAVPFDPASHGAEDLLGVADAPRRGDYVAKEEDEGSTFTYEAAENDRVVAGGDADHDVIKVRTIEDAGGPAPSISGDTVVGVIDSSDADAPSGVAGRLVEEGYTADADGDGTSTTFNRTNGNFYAVGVAHRDEATSHDEVVRVEVQRDLN